MSYPELCTRLAELQRQLERQDAVRAQLMLELAAIDGGTRVLLGDDFRAAWSEVVAQVDGLAASLAFTTTRHQQGALRA